MLISFCFLALALGASAAPFKSCGPQNIVLKQVTDTWSLPLTKMAPMSTCTYSFQIPNGTFAEVILSASGLGHEDTLYVAGIETAFGGPNESYQITTLSPSKFDVTITAQANSTMSVQFMVDLQKVNNAVSSSVSVKSNGDSKLLYIDEWQIGTACQVSADTLLRLNVAFNGVNSVSMYQLNNIFIYDGANEPHTILGYQSYRFISESKNVLIYYARKITDLEGALFLTDASNLQGIMNHYAEFVPTDPNQPSTFVSINADYRYKPDSPWGAVTIVGKAIGTPFDVRSLNVFGGNGTFLHAVGGPLPNHPNGKVFGKKNLPLHADGQLNTFYLTQGEANFMYTIN